MWVIKPIIILFCIVNVLCVQFKRDPKFFNNVVGKSDAKLNINQLAEKYGYQCESHWVNTEDGYVLVMHRIRKEFNSNGNFGTDTKPVVLIMHGITGSSIEWINMGSNNSLAFNLVDAGYDVWLGNNRGNVYSRYHVTLDPDIDDTFWDFSFEECGYYDLPAKIDYIIQHTDQQKIFYVGLSQGTTQFFAMAALRPEYNDKIALMSAFAPVAYMAHTSSPIIKIAVKYMDTLEKLAKKLKLNEVLSQNSIISEISQILCSNTSKIQELCVLPRFLTFGFDTQQLDRSALDVQVAHSSAGTSIKSLLHFGQLILSGDFKRYDYGTKLNKKYYNSATPPSYNLSAITTPVALYYGQNDLIASVQDVERLASALPNLAKKQLIDYKRWTHLDFLYARDVYKLLNVDVLQYQQELIDYGILSSTTTTAKPKENNAYSIEKGVGLTLIFSYVLLMFV